MSNSIMKKWISAMLTVLLLVNSFVSPISVIAEGTSAQIGTGTPAQNQATPNPSEQGQGTAPDGQDNPTTDGDLEDSPSVDVPEDQNTPSVDEGEQNTPSVTDPEAGGDVSSE